MRFKLNSLKEFARAIGEFNKSLRKSGRKLFIETNPGPCAAHPEARRASYDYVLICKDFSRTFRQYIGRGYEFPEYFLVKIEKRYADRERIYEDLAELLGKKAEKLNNRNALTLVCKIQERTYSFN